MLEKKQAKIQMIYEQEEKVRKRILWFLSLFLKYWGKTQHLDKSVMWQLIRRNTDKNISICNSFMIQYVFRKKKISCKWRYFNQYVS